jgi:hypothetical protein
MKIQTSQRCAPTAYKSSLLGRQHGVWEGLLAFKLDKLKSCYELVL